MTALPLYAGLFLLVAAESAGVPLPGETALIAAGVATGTGRLSLPLVAAVAAAAAIVGDNVGYVAGRLGARRALARPGRWERRRRELLVRGEAFFARHGGKAVFLGRFVTGVRVVVAWTAGAGGLSWPRFLFWNALGAIVWAGTVATAAHFLGRAASRDLGLVGAGLGGLAVAGATAWVLLRLRRRRRA